MVLDGSNGAQTPPDVPKLFLEITSTVVERVEKLSVILLAFSEFFLIFTTDNGHAAQNFMFAQWTHYIHIDPCFTC